MMSTPDPHAPLRCDSVRAHQAAYTAGTLPGTTAWAIDQHLAECEHCARLLTASATVDRTAIVHAMQTFAPTELERTAMRRAVQSQIGVAPRQRWRSGRAALAAAAVLLVVWRVSIGRGSTDRAIASGPDPATVTAAVPATTSAALPAALVQAVALAEADARRQFATLDLAARELDAQLAAQPDDADLRRFRATLEQRRQEITRLAATVAE